MSVYLFWGKDGNPVQPGTPMPDEATARQKVLERFPAATFTGRTPCVHQPGPMRSCDEMLYAKSGGGVVAEIWFIR